MPGRHCSSMQNRCAGSLPTSSRNGCPSARCPRSQVKPPSDAYTHSKP
ncbi:hypothetical protein J2852_004900 [Azospirillum soli]|nr:hypothetical protein [Azospirillum soli]